MVVFRRVSGPGIEPASSVLRARNAGARPRITPGFSSCTCVLRGKQRRSYIFLYPEKPMPLYSLVASQE